MAESFELSLVAPRRIERAVRFIIAGGLGEAGIETRAGQFIHLLRSRSGGQPRVWRAHRRRKTLAAAAVMPVPGRTGTLFYSPTCVPDVETEALVEVVGAACRDALDAGATFVQALLKPDDSDAKLVARAGLRQLTTLIYMKRELTPAQAPPAEQQQRLSWRNGLAFDASELQAVIEATYAGSLDCPELAGIRCVSDVVAGHKAAGNYRPESWWLAARSGKAAGCVLVNDSPSSPSADVAYMGVVPEFRGLSIGRTMLQRAIRQASRRGLAQVTLAVDRRNAPARRIYRSEAFRPTCSRLVHAITARR